MENESTKNLIDTVKKYTDFRAIHYSKKCDSEYHDSLEELERRASFWKMKSRKLKVK